jgi:hypothetical protein
MVACRLKTEMKLSAAIDRYDNEIGNRHEMIQELNETYENDKLEKQALEVILSLLSLY